MQDVDLDGTENRPSLAEEDGPLPRKLVSIVTPVCNEEENIDVFYAALEEALASEAERYDFEYIFTDNHSDDRTFEKLAALASNDSRIRIYRFSKNFGYQKSIYEGYMRAAGDCAMQIDVDLQDPPRLMSEFLRLWEQGYSVVYGIRRKREEGFVINSLRRIFYRILSAMSADGLPHDAGDFRLVDRVILDNLRRIDDPNIYIRGRISTMGFRQIGILYDRAGRNRGKSKFRFHDYVSLAVDAMTAHSSFPLRLATYFGAIVMLATLVGIAGYFIAYATVGSLWPTGFATLVLLLLATLGVVSLFLGIIGEYVARIYEHLKQPTGVIIESTIDNRSIKSPSSNNKQKQSDKDT